MRFHEAWNLAAEYAESDDEYGGKICQKGETGGLLLVPGFYHGRYEDTFMEDYSDEPEGDEWYVVRV